MNNQSTIDPQEINQFARHSSQWWDLSGSFKTLHDINPARLELIARHMNLKDKRVLDVGCGGGILSEAMAKSGAKVTGIDAGLEAIEIAKQHAKDNKLSIQYQCMPIEEYESKPFDLITCMELLEHVNHPELILEHCKRLLKPNGLLFLSTISRTPKAYINAIIGAEYILNLLPKQTHDYKKFIKPSELNAMARSFDLNRIDLCGLNYNPFTKTASLSSDVTVNYLMVFEGS